MLKPGGQLFFTAFEKIFFDEVYEKMDQGKWSKYHNYKAISPFYKSKYPLKEYESIIKSLGFVDCHMFTEAFTPQMSEKSFEGKWSSIYYRYSDKQTIKNILCCH